jgi:hypothetical protein
MAVNGGRGMELPLPSAQALRPAFEALERARRRSHHARPHRGLVRLEFAPYLVQVVLLPAFFIALLLEIEPALVDFWREFVMAWAQLLDIPVKPSGRPAGWGELRLVWLFLESPTLLPGRAVLIAGLAIACLGFAATCLLRPQLVPLKYVARIGCTLLAISALVFLFGSFPYSITDHVLALTGGGFILMATIPVMLALGYYVLRIPLAVKIFHTTLVMGYFAVLVPLQVVVHMVLLQHLTVLVMPILYFVFGTLLNFVLFIALYSWIASTAPMEASGGPKATRS